MLEDVDLDQLVARRFLVKDGFAGGAAAAAAHAEVLALPLRPAGMGRSTTYHRDGATRGDEIAWLTAEEARAGARPALAALCSRFEALRVQLNRAAYLGLERFDLQAARYAGGGACYVRHRDAFAGWAAAHRRLTAILYLNPGWQAAQGGLLRLHLPDGGHEDVAPLLDRLVVFPSEELEHEVLPVHAPRLALTAWYYGSGVGIT